MAKSGQWGIHTTDKDLEIVKSAGNHFCCGVYDLSDRIVRSPFCSGRIKPKDLYCRNMKAPREVLYVMAKAGGFSWPTCLACVLEVHPTVLTGDPIDRLMAVMMPITDETRQQVAERLQAILDDLAA